MPPDHHAPDALTMPLRTGARRLLVAILPAAGLVSAASTIVAVALPAIMDALSMGTAAIGWLVTGYLVLIAVLHTPAGWLGDHIGHRRLLLVGTALLAASSLAAAASTGPAPLIAARLTQGVAGAAIIPAALALIRRQLPDRHRSRAVGAFLATMAAGAVLGVTAGGILVALGGWRAPFVALAVVAVAALAVAATHRTVSLHGRVQDRDEPTAEPSRPRWRALGVPAAGIALVNLALYVVLLALPLHLDDVGWSAAVAGPLLGAFTAASAGGALAASWLSTRMGRSRSIAIGAATAGLALALIAVAPSVLPWLLPALAAGGAGLGIAMSGLYDLGLEAAPRDAAGASSGLLSTARYAGSITGSAALPTALAAGGHTAAMAFAAASVLAIAALPLTRP